MSYSKISKECISNYEVDPTKGISDDEVSITSSCLETLENYELSLFF